jgi:prolyl-tRNA editing enzyme YbaK/EbsC (Cys-tRNA(Pro) deacylase)
VDALVADTPVVVIGSGVRRSKLILAGKLLASLPGVRVIDGLAR